MDNRSKSPGRRNDDLLLEYRVNKLEEIQAKMSGSLDSLVSDVRVAKWVIGAAIGVVQPIVVGCVVYAINNV